MGKGLKKYFSKEEVKRSSKRCQHQPWLGLRWLSLILVGSSSEFWVLGLIPGWGVYRRQLIPSPPRPSPSPIPFPTPHFLSKISKHITYSWVDNNKKMSTLLITKEMI